MILEGQVTTGLGWHKNNMGPWKVLPFKAYPGTLNVEVGKRRVQKFVATTTRRAESKVRSNPYRMGSLNGITVAVTDSDTEPDQIEVIAPVRLRDLPLRDGDTVSIMICDEVE